MFKCYCDRVHGYSSKAMYVILQFANHGHFDHIFYKAYIKTNKDALRQGNLTNLCPLQYAYNIEKKKCRSSSSLLFIY